MFKRFVIFFFILFIPSSLRAEDYKVINVKDNVWRFTAGNYHSVFITTPSGVIVTDPISKSAAAFLKQYISEHFNKPITYMLYSHNHVDHVTGGEALLMPDTQVVAHTLAAQDITFTDAPTAEPEITFDDHMTIRQDDTQITMTYHGTNNGRGSVSYHITPANVLYVVDWIVVGRMPYRNLIGYEIQGMINSTQAVLNTIDFDIFVGGHADIGKREDVEHYLGYITALYRAVKDGMLAGKKLPELQQSIHLDDYKDLKMYDEWLAENIEGVYNTLIESSYFNFRTDLDTEF